MFAILIVLLRSLVAPLLLIVSVIVSFAAALGTGILVSEHIFGFTGVGPTLPLLAFVFLVALGIDYNIFLMARVREEAIKHGTREGTLRGLAVTGAVITGAGIVLAGTFGALAVLPLVVLTQIGFIVAFGVLLDTFVVRSVIVPAAVIDVGRRVWWPSKLPQARLKNRQVALELPGSDLDAVVLPLLALDLDVAVEDVLAERAQHELGLGGDLDRLAQRLRQLLDAEPAALVGREVVEVLLHRLGQLVAALDALQAGLQQHRERQVRVAGGIGRAQLHARRVLLAGVVERDAHQRGAVAA